MLLPRTLEVHLDPRFNRIPQRAMSEASGIEVSPQFSIEAMQNVQVERRGDSIVVVISSQERAFFFHHICTEQQRISGSQLATQISQNELRFFRREVADTR